MKQKILFLILALTMLVTFCSCGSSLYESAKVTEVKSADGTVIGAYSLMTAKSSDIKKAKLEDLYFNYIEPNNISFAVVVYSDKEGYGTVCMGDLLYKDCQITKAEDGTYNVGNVDGATVYMVENETLSELST